jgi:hypothetical protein
MSHNIGITTKIENVLWVVLSSVKIKKSYIKCIFISFDIKSWKIQNIYENNNVKEEYCRNIRSCREHIWNRNQFIEHTWQPEYYEVLSQTFCCLLFVFDVTQKKIHFYSNISTKTDRVNAARSIISLCEIIISIITSICLSTVNVGTLHFYYKYFTWSKKIVLPMYSFIFSLLATHPGFVWMQCWC